ncbi:MAG TPA: hypothetical protein VIY56_04465 [Vicinamibacterales bacterium]
MKLVSKVVSKVVGVGTSKVWLAGTLVVALGAGACAEDKGTPTTPTPSVPTLTAPAIEAPAADAQLDTLRPMLTVRNGTSNQTGTRTYEFQVATTNSFSPVAVSRAGVAEDASGRTSYTADFDLQPATVMYWRSRVTQGTTNSDWSTTGSFRTKPVGFNRPGELYDPLQGDTLGTSIGGTSFAPGEGLRVDNENAYVRYQLGQTIPSGEMSVEVKGLRPNVPGAGGGSKYKVFSMMDGTGDLIASRYQLSVQYRGLDGNPDNCISFKAVWADRDVKLEPDLGQRSADVRILDPSRWYLWTATWNPTAFRLVIRVDGPAGAVIYERTISAPGGTGPYAPSPHFVYLGANSGAYGTENGSVAGLTYRNLWVGSGPRPAALGNALR